MDQTIHSKVYQIFKLIRLLDKGSPKTVPQLVETLNSSKSNIYRNLSLLKEIGYPINTDNQHRKYIEVTPSGNNHKLESEEWSFIQELLQQRRSSSSIASGIINKLNLNLSLIPLADALPGLHKGRLIQLIKAAIDTESCIHIKGYRSITSNNISNRYVEPLELTEDYRYLIAWDIDKKGQRQFKLDRMEDIDLSTNLISSGHIASPMDLFGLTGPNWQDVVLELSSAAHHLIIEEYPLSKQFIRKQKDKILFDGRVRNWKGIGRFILGLPGEIIVHSPNELKAFLKEKIALF